MFFIKSAALATDFFVTDPAEIRSAVQQAQPGDTLTMKNGYWKDVQIIFEGNGTETDSILLRAETPGMVRITGRSYLRIGGEYLIVKGLFKIRVTITM